MKRVLDVGSGDANIPLPPEYDGWERHRLDIDEVTQPEVLCDARLLTERPDLKGQYDAVYCSHNLEHYYRHDIRKVLEGFQHVLRPEGMVDIYVPDLKRVCRHIAAGGNPNGILYTVPAKTGLLGITPLDIIYGSAMHIMESGDFMCHKTGFTAATLRKTLEGNGFAHVTVQEGTARSPYELHAVGVKL